MIREDMERVPLGSGFFYTWVSYEAVRVGIILWYDACAVHEECRGLIPFANYPDKDVRWELIREEPLTITPSVLQQPCNFHGFITDGRWVSA